MGRDADGPVGKTGAGSVLRVEGEGARSRDDEVLYEKHEDSLRCGLKVDGEGPPAHFAAVKIDNKVALECGRVGRVS